MSDVRNCDGPGCKTSSPLGETTKNIGDFTAEDFITLESYHHGNLHFHNEHCLSSWTAANTKVKGDL